MEKLKIDTRTGEMSLNGEDMGVVEEVNVKIHDDDRITVSIILPSGKKIISPCEVDAHIGVVDGRLGWMDRV